MNFLIFLRLVPLKYLTFFIFIFFMSILCLFFVRDNKLIFFLIFTWLFVLSLLLLATYKKVFIELTSAKNGILKKMRNDYNQLEALLNIFWTLNIQYPFPPTRGWAASPDFLRLIILNIFSRKPQTILEASSGISSLIIAYSLKKLGKGMLISLEHDKFFYERTKELILMHNLENYCHLIYAPLVEYKIKNKIYKWYDIKSLPKDIKINLFVIDGPPGHIGRLARLPAIPLLYERLSSNCNILLDDGARQEEKEIVKIWKRDYNFKKVEYLSELEKGAYILEK